MSVSDETFLFECYMKSSFLIFNKNMLFLAAYNLLPKSLKCSEELNSNHLQITE